MLKDMSDIAQRVFPQATPATWWILMMSENPGDAVLYRILAEITTDYHPSVLMEQRAKLHALVTLKRVESALQEAGIQEVRDILATRPTAATTNSTVRRTCPTAGAQRDMGGLQSHSPHH